eukprot:16073528-Heterocapsa_arctica.AAC.1
MIFMIDKHQRKKNRNWRIPMGTQMLKDILRIIRVELMRNERESKQLTDEVFKQNKTAKIDNVNRKIIAEERKRKE